MEKFSYAVEFYREGIFDLDNVELFKRKVEEAQKIENYFSKLVPNVSFIRPYILNSYKFEKIIGYVNRIRYVRGLIYASDYIDFEDVLAVADDIKIFYENGLLDEDSKKSSLWKELEYIETSNYDKILSGYNYDDEEELEDEDSFEIDEKLVDLLNNNQIELQSEEMNNLVKIFEDEMNGSNCDEEYEEDFDDDNIEAYISIGEKLNRFRKNSSVYIENTIKSKLSNGSIKNEDIPMIKRAMKRWFKTMFYIVERIDEFDCKEYNYNDENINRFL